MSLPSLVSIIAPCYNGEKTLPAFMDSVLAQTYPNIELILINDGSTDKTEQIVLEKYAPLFDQKNISLIYHYQENQGQAAAINYGLSCFSGEYMMWADSDDILYADNVEKKIEFLKSNPECGFVIAKLETVRIDNPDERLSVQGRQSTDDTNYFEDMINGKNVVFGPGTIMVRRSVFLETFPSRKIFPSREGQNWQLMLPLIYNNKCGCMDEVLLKCVVHESSHSRRKRTTQEYIDRNDGICLLLCETIQSIRSMGQEEKDKWIKYITNKYANANLYLCYEDNNKELSQKYKGILKKNRAYSLKRTWLVYYAKKMLKGFKNKV